MMTLAQEDRTLLGSVRLAPASTIRFCSRCGVVLEERHARGARAPERVCRECGMGVLLSCPRGSLAGDGTAFLIATEDLRISAVSEAAERLLGAEADLLGTMLLATLTSPLGNEELALQVARAANGGRDVAVLPVELVRGARPGFRELKARIAPCGPPRGALVAIEPLAVPAVLA